MANPTLDRTPQRIIESCSSGAALDELWNLKMDGSDDYIQSNTSFPQWDRGQAWTMFARMQDNSGGSIYSTSDGSKGVELYRGVSGEWTVKFLDGTLSLTVTTAADATYYLDVILQITYDGSSTVGGVSFYINNVSTFSFGAGSLGATIINASNLFLIGKQSTVVANLLNTNCAVQEVSFVDYVKSGVELTSDYNAGTQSIGTGAWLLNVQPVYDTYITTLDSTQTFDTAAGTTYSMDIIGKPATMSLGSDFTKQT